MVGFKELLRRLQIQEQMTKQHQTRVDVSLFRLLSKCKKKQKKKQTCLRLLLLINKGILWCQRQSTQMSWPWLMPVGCLQLEVEMSGLNLFLIIGDKFNAKQFL